MPTVLLATILSMACALIPATQQREAAKSPFIGSWSADLSQSRLDPKMSFKGADITISVTGNLITLASTVVMPSGERYKSGRYSGPTELKRRLQVPRGRCMWRTG